MSPLEILQSHLATLFRLEQESILSSPSKKDVCVDAYRRRKISCYQYRLWFLMDLRL